MNQAPSSISSGKSQRIVIIGGVAAGASAAARARRLSETSSITLVERGPDVSFANCGLPYHIGGEITDRSRLALQTPESLRSLLAIDVRAGTEALSIDRTHKTVTVRRLADGREEFLAYDKLLLAPGAAPLRPPLPGIDDPRILTLRNLQDMDRIKQAASTARRTVIIGAGFIGLEMAEQLHRLGKEVTVVEMLDQVLPQMDPEMTLPIRRELESQGVKLVLGDGIASFVPSPGGLNAVLKSGREIAADLVLLSIGVRPENQLAKAAGLELGARGGIRVNPWLQTSDPDIYAAGDAVESTDRLTGTPMSLPLGGPANRQGRTAADHMFMGDSARPYPGHTGTAIVRVFDTVAAVTGWTEKRLRTENKPFGTTTVTDHQHAGYYPGAVPITLKILWNPEDGVLYGAQCSGVDGVDKRIDVLATALSARLTIDNLADLELAYAPPFGSARDVVNTAGFAARNIRDGLNRPVRSLTPESGVILDVRPKAMADAAPVAGALNIPFPELRSRLGELDRSKEYTTVCALGKTSYFAHRVLEENGFRSHSLAGGLRLLQPPTPVAAAPSSPASAETTLPAAVGPVVKVDACGLACPGPLLKVRQSLDALPEGGSLEVTASDPGFAADIVAFCRSTGLPEPVITKQKGIIHALICKTQSGLSPATARGASGANPDTTLVVFSQEMDKALAALVIANGAAAMGGKVTLFFTFWGLNVLRRDPAPPVAKGLLDRVFGFMLPRGPGQLPLSNMHFAGMGTAMMKWRMGSKGLPNLPGLLAAARDQKVRLVACSMSMDAMGLRKEELVDGVEIGGVADFMAASAASGTNLFI